jgi:hypothetical protein
LPKAAVVTYPRPSGTRSWQDAQLGRTLATRGNSAGRGLARSRRRRADRTIAEADPKQAKALLLIKELKLNGRSEILPTYRVVTPEVCAVPGSVGGTGIEPVTSGLSSRRSPS